MKVEFNRPGPKPPVRYPVIRESVHEEGLLVLFTASNTGFVLASAPGVTWNVGKHLTCWDPEAFKPFDGTVTLSND